MARSACSGGFYDSLRLMAHGVIAASTTFHDRPATCTQNLPFSRPFFGSFLPSALGW
jgi:hypothetical protein